MNDSQQRLLDALGEVLPAANLLWKQEDTAPYECDGLAAYRQLPLAVALPENEAQVQAVLRLCLAHGVPVVPRGAGTGLSGGAMPMAEGIVLSTAKMNRIINVDPLSRRAVLQPTMSQTLLDRKLGHILKTSPDEIVSGNMGCINHLQSGTELPVRHWVELIDRMI